MWTKTVQWRADEKLDTALDGVYERAALIKSVFPGAFHGFDKKGRPMYIEMTGSLDVATITKSCTFEEIVFYHLHTTEFLRKYLMQRGSARVGGRHVDQVTTILNLKVGTQAHVQAEQPGHTHSCARSHLHGGTRRLRRIRPT